MWLDEESSRCGLFRIENCVYCTVLEKLTPLVCALFLCYNLGICLCWESCHILSVLWGFLWNWPTNLGQNPVCSLYIPFLLLVFQVGPTYSPRLLPWSPMSGKRYQKCPLGKFGARRNAIDFFSSAEVLTYWQFKTESIVYHLSDSEV